MSSLQVPANRDALDSVREFIEIELEDTSCPAKAAYQIDVVIEEIVVNIVDYSGLTDQDLIEIKTCIEKDPDRITIAFIDAGVTFDPLAADEPDTSEEGLLSHEGGLGIFMVRKMMDDVAYVRRDGKNIFTIVKNFYQPAK